MPPKQGSDDRLNSGEPPCWGESGLPLLPSAWQSRIPDHDLGIPFRRLNRRTLSLHQMFRVSDWSSVKWPQTTIDAAQSTFEALLEDSRTHDAIDMPLLTRRIEDPNAVAHLPLLTRTWEALEEGFDSNHDLAEFLATGTGLDLLQLTGCPQSTIDVAITVPSWSRNTTRGHLRIAKPERPAGILRAFELAGERHVRTLCVQPNHADPASGWSSAIAGRSGASIDGTLTLEEAGGLIGVTRERFRQVASGLPLTHSHRRRWPLSPELHRLDKVFENCVGRPLDDIEADLRSCSIGDEALDFDRALSLLDWYGRSWDLEIDATLHVQPAAAQLNLPEGLSINRIRNMVWEMSEGTGFLREDDLLRELEQIAPNFDPELRERAINLAIGKDRLPLGYLFVAKHRDPTVVGVLKKTLSWTNPLPLAEIHESLVRRFRFRRFPAPPPPQVLGALIERLDGFEFEDGQVRATTPDEPDRETVLGWITEQLQLAESQVLHRSILYEAARRAGKKTVSVGLYLQFGETTRPTGRGCFRLVGSHPDAEAIERARAEAIRLRVADGRRTAYPDGGIRLELTVGNGLLDSGVLSIPARAQRLIANRSLALSSDLGSHGNLGLSNTLLYGFTTALQTLDVMPGDQVTVDLDLRANSAHISLGSEEN